MCTKVARDRKHNHGETSRRTKSQFCLGTKSQIKVDFSVSARLSVQFVSKPIETTPLLRPPDILGIRSGFEGTRYDCVLISGSNEEEIILKQQK